MKKYCQKLLSFILSVGVCISLAGPVCAETAQPPVSEGVGIVESVPTSVCSEEDIAETVADSIEPENAASSEGAVSIESQSVSEPENVQNTDNNEQEISNTSESSSLQDESEIEATSTEENSARTYYVDAVNGQDENDGLTVETAWKNLDKINFNPAIRFY